MRNVVARRPDGPILDGRVTPNPCQRDDGRRPGGGVSWTPRDDVEDIDRGRIKTAGRIDARGSDRRRYARRSLPILRRCDRVDGSGPRLRLPGVLLGITAARGPRRPAPRDTRSAPLWSPQRPRTPGEIAAGVREYHGQSPAKVLLGRTVNGGSVGGRGPLPDDFFAESETSEKDDIIQRGSLSWDIGRIQFSSRF